MSFFCKFENGAYAKVWKVFRREEKYIDVSADTSEKDTDGKWRNSKWDMRLVGHAKNDLKDIQEGERIVITSAKITNESYKDKEGNWKTSLKVVVLEAHRAGENANGETAAPRTKTTSHPAPAVADDGDAPW